MPQVSLLLPLLLLLPGVPPAAQTRTLAITGVSVIDVKTGETRPNVTVVIDGRVITAVGPGIAAPRGARIVDGRGRFLIPGLWDMHSHHEGTGEASAPLFVANGVTGTRDMGSSLDFILALREETASGRVLGPRIVAAGPILDDAPPDWPFRLRVRTAAAAREAVRQLKQRGVDFIKVHDHTPRDAYFAIADEAGRQGLPFAGHVPIAVTLIEAAEAGQKSIEHLANFRIFTECSSGAIYHPEPCQSLFALLARRRVWQTPTLAFARAIMTIGASPEDAAANHVEYASPSLRKIWADNQRASNASPERIRAFQTLADSSLRVVRDLHAAGVGLLAGCDGLVPGFCVADELVAMTRAGLSPLAALQTATIGPAQFLGLDASAGTIERGRSADLVLLDANPLESIANVRRIAAVVRNGVLLTRADLDAILRKAKDAFGTTTPASPELPQRLADREAVRLAALDYLDGFYEGDAGRIVRSVRPDVRKTGFFANRDVYEKEEMTYAAMIDYANDVRRTGRRPPPNAPRDVTVGEVNDQTATAKVVAWWGIDYLHLARYGDRWMIVNVMWQSPPK